MTVPGGEGARAARHRLAWIDTMRGLAVLLVIVAHGVELTPYTPPRTLVVVDLALMPYRVPALMFLSGMLLPASLSKPWPVYVRGKVSRILWPYLVWSTILLVLRSFGEPGPSPLIELFLNPTSPTWFVGYLFVFYLLARLTSPTVRTALLLPALGAALFFDPVHGLGPAADLVNGRLTRFLFTFFCFLAGDLLARHQGRWLPFLTRTRVAVACGLLALPAAALSILGFAVRFQPLFAICTLAGIVAAVSPMMRLAATRVGVFLARQGRQSIVFYLSHYPAQVVAWHAAVAAGVRSGTAIVLVNLVVGAGAGFAMVWLRRRVPLVDHLFDLHLERWTQPGDATVVRAPADPGGAELSRANPAPPAEA